MKKNLFYSLLSIAVFMLIYSCAASDDPEITEDLECYVKADCPEDELCSQDNKCYKPYGDSDEDLTSTPDSDIVETPDPDVTETPDPDTAETPDPDVTETPDPDVTETPDPDVTETPDPDVTETPDPDVTETPDPDVTETPDPDVTETPDPDVAETPDADENTTSELIISEYLEGEKYNKALELYNATSSSIDLDDYTVEVYKNGSLTASPIVDTSKGLTGTLESGATFVIINNNAEVSTELTAVMNIKVTSFDFNGDDAIVLKHNGTIVDIFGNVGEDPGTAWLVQEIADATKDHKFIRKPEIKSGNIDWTTNQSEWDISDAVSDFSTLGTHSVD